jgi:hypothetical protein
MARPIKMLTVIKRRPFCTWFVIALTLWIILSVWKPEYDGGGLGGLLVLTPALWGLPIYLPHEMLFSLNEGRGFALQTPIAIVIGGAGCVVCDCILQSILSAARRRRKLPANDGN